MSCSTDPSIPPAERRRIEALRAAVEVAGWARSAADPEAVIEIAEAFEDYIRGDLEDGGDE